MSEHLLDVQGLKKWFPVESGLIENLITRDKSFVRAVDGVDFHIQRGEVLGLVGESGSGKTTTGRLILRLIEPTAGQVTFDGIDVLGLPNEQMRGLRQRMQIIFQDPFASLNPRMKVGDAIGHGLVIHHMAKGHDKRDRVCQVMDQVGLKPAPVLYEKYPHQLSGGQRQRVVVARALATLPDLVIADEPIAMADVSVRAMLLELLIELKEELDLTYLFITHDLATAKYICNRIAIMYLGRIVEVGPLWDVYSDPQHPYTQALLAAVPVPDPKARRTHPMPKGEIPNPTNPPSGCRFHPRCPQAQDGCSELEPNLVEVSPGHLVACHR
ncbi:MAG: ABC transporter ATP-binding protein [Chloroflexi bacterium]|nr:ABC transporter ATP-binding protein [Chloroflexota bacterium]MBU1746230.1 ABC transporter ATP-binding protein [Chloroflexota bacterium]